jgi:signal transduction histidine kinase
MIEMPGLIDSVLAIYSNKLKSKNVSVELDFGACLPVHGVPGELKQVFSNLIANAVDAVSPDGTIRVTARCVEDAAGSAVQIVVEDDGPGIAEEHVHRIFEPFFTTKQDVGTGLGLWVTKEIIDRHGGSILVRPRSDGDSGGAVFTINLPLSPNGRKSASSSE